MSYETLLNHTYFTTSDGITTQASSNLVSSQTVASANSFSPSGIMFSSAVTGTWFSILGLLGLASVAVAAEKTDRCYSCASANFDSKWPRNPDNKILYLSQFPPYLNDSCKSMRGSLPVVPCTNSVCVKLIIEETYSGRAVCASESGPVIIRDCWSRVLGQENNPIKPTNTKPVRLANPTDISKTIGHILTCEGYLCNHGLIDNQISFLTIFTSLFVIIITSKLLI